MSNWYIERAQRATPYDWSAWRKQAAASLILSSLLLLMTLTTLLGWWLSDHRAAWAVVIPILMGGVTAWPLSQVIRSARRTHALRRHHQVVTGLVRHRRVIESEEYPDEYVVYFTVPGEVVIAQVVHHDRYQWLAPGTPVSVYQWPQAPSVCALVASDKEPRPSP